MHSCIHHRSCSPDSTHPSWALQAPDFNHRDFLWGVENPPAIDFLQIKVLLVLDIREKRSESRQQHVLIDVTLEVLGNDVHCSACHCDRSEISRQPCPMGVGQPDQPNRQQVVMSRFRDSACVVDSSKADFECPSDRYVSEANDQQ